ncbi:transcription factor TFIIIB subunit brf1 [Gurleya vavrai]
MLTCSNCNSSSLFSDSTLGHLLCTSCGTILTESIPLSNVNFTKSSSGESHLSGQLIALSSTTTCHKNTFYSTSHSDKILSLLETICSTCSLPNSFATVSFRFYKLSLQHDLTKGRGILYTLAACLYISCRMEKMPMMIVDFSALMRISCGKLGKVYGNIVNKLGLKIQNNDASFYLKKYIEQLNLKNKIKEDFDEKNNEIYLIKKMDPLALTNRIVSWMKRDWIITGRRPNNVCGAAIVISSRILGDERSIEEVAKVVKGGVSTIQKRIKEISDTETAEMNLETFMRVWLEKEEDPPLVKIRRRNEDELKRRNIAYKLQVNEDETKRINVEYKITNNDESKRENEEFKIKNNKDEYNRKNDEEKSFEKDSSDKENCEFKLESCAKTKKGVKINFIEEKNYCITQVNEIDFSNDSEINDCLLSDFEIKKREEVWNEMYEEFMKEKENRPPVIKKSKKKSNLEVKEKKKSSKLNYNALEHIFD